MSLWLLSQVWRDQGVEWCYAEGIQKVRDFAANHIFVGPLALKASQVSIVLCHSFTTATRVDIMICT